MISTFLASGNLASPAAFLTAFIIGISFGWCLEQAGFGSSKKLTGVFYFKDMTVIKVMFSAVITASIGLALVIKTGILSIDSIFIQETILGGQIVGGILLGIGFIVGGWCPGTAAVGAVSGKIDALIFIFGALLGSYIFNLTFGYLQFWYSWGYMGQSFLYELLNVSYFDFVLLVVIAGVGIFWFSELIEEKFSFSAVAERSSGLWIFSVVMLLCGCLVMAMGRPSFILTNGAHEKADSINKFEHLKIGAEELVVELMGGQKKIAIVDLRSEGDYDTWHISGSVHSSSGSVIEKIARYKEFDRIIFIAGESVLLGALQKASDNGLKNVHFIRGGLDSFFENVLKPVSLRTEPLTAEKAAQINSWRAHFLGSAQAVGAADPVIFNNN